MDNQYVTVDTGLFRSKWMPVTALFAVLATALGLPGVVLLFNPEYTAYLAEELASSGIQSADARMTWQVINNAMTVLSFICPAMIAACLLLSLWGQPGKGMDFLYWVAQVMFYVINVVGVVILAIFVFRVIRYVITCLDMDTGIYMVYTMLIPEGILAVVVWFLFVNLRRFANCVCDSAASMAFTLSSGKVDSVPIPAFTVTGFLILGIICAVLGLDRLVTLAVVQDYTGAYYAILPVKNPVQVLEGVSFLCSGCANFLISRYVRQYKRICERVLYERRWQTRFGSQN